MKLSSVLKYALAIFLFSGLSKVQAAGECLLAFGPREVAKDATYSEWFRSNAPHYWAFAHKHAEAYFGEEALKYTGIISGDAHPGNFGPILLGGKTKWLNLDFDDSGKGPFALDIARFVGSIKAIEWDSKKDPDIKIPEMLEAYLAGLKGQRRAPPESVSELLVSPAEFRRLEEEYVGKQVEGERFRSDKDDLSPLLRNTDLQKKTYDQLKAQMKKALGEGQVLDIAKRAHESGGSRKGERFWALVKSNKALRIVEFKEVLRPATSYMNDQKGHEDRWEETRKVFWSEQDRDSAFQLVTLNEKLFWMRPKKPVLLDIPYNVGKKSEIAFLYDLAVYDAWHLGRIHGEQRQGREFAKYLEENFEDFRRATKEFVNDYLE